MRLDPSEIKTVETICNFSGFEWINIRPAKPIQYLDLYLQLGGEASTPSPEGHVWREGPLPDWVGQEHVAKGDKRWRLFHVKIEWDVFKKGRQRVPPACFYVWQHCHDVRPDKDVTNLYGMQKCLRANQTVIDNWRPFSVYGYSPPDRSTLLITIPKHEIFPKGVFWVEKEPPYMLHLHMINIMHEGNVITSTPERFTLVSWLCAGIFSPSSDRHIVCLVWSSVAKLKPLALVVSVWYIFSNGAAEMWRYFDGELACPLPPGYVWVPRKAARGCSMGWAT